MIVAAEPRLMLTLAFIAGFGLGAFVNLTFSIVVLFSLVNRLEQLLCQAQSSQ
jgi:hypothetical protein